MKSFRIPIGALSLPAHAVNTVVVGSGAAGFGAALRLHQFGQTDIALLTEGVNTGTSRNAGSDKQTYYKLSLSGGAPDSPADMARDLFAGGCVDGDVALAEAALSARCFLYLCELGVAFPVNRHGEYVGYKTDHDPRARATSAGPLTSKAMTETLERAARDRDIPVLDNLQAVAILKDGERACGVLALNKAGLAAEETRFTVILARNIIWATGGPAGIYADTVYPVGHSGATGVALEAGVLGRSLTEWQYGLASVAPRWNVSGTYMQALPRLISVDADGVEREFLAEAIPDEDERLSLVFRKGYEWPFDSRKAADGSSRVDLLVYRERVLLGRRVYLDFRRNPGNRDALDYALLTPEAREYLAAAGACFGAPIDRLRHMNEPAYALYLGKGVDLAAEPLEIALCAQHMNGGLDVDAWWRTNVPGVFAVGEAAGTHGAYRPGGSALNAGQVGALRAARYIAAHGGGEAGETLPEGAAKAIAEHMKMCRGLLGGGAHGGEGNAAGGRPRVVGASPEPSAGCDADLGASCLHGRSFDVSTRAGTVGEGSQALEASPEPSAGDSVNVEASRLRACSSDAPARVCANTGMPSPAEIPPARPIPLAALSEASAHRMSAAGAAIRDPKRMRETLAETTDLIGHFASRVILTTPSDLPEAYRLRDALIARQAVLSAMLDYVAHGGGSRGSAVYAAEEGISCEIPSWRPLFEIRAAVNEGAPLLGLPADFRFQPDDGALSGQVQLVRWSPGGVRCAWRPVRPLPEGGGVFETVWRAYRENGNIG